MPETIEDYYARVMAAADQEGRLTIPADGIPSWEIFPFESEGLRLKPLEPLAEVESPRLGEDPTQCQCAEPQSDDQWAVWTDDHWKVRLFEAHLVHRAADPDPAVSRHDDGRLGRLPTPHPGQRPRRERACRHTGSGPDIRRSRPRARSLTTACCGETTESCRMPWGFGGPGARSAKVDMPGAPAGPGWTGHPLAPTRLSVHVRERRRTVESVAC